MITVIIPARNAGHTIGACLDALQAQTAVPDAYEILVVDDGSSDDTAAVARRHGAQVISQPHQGPAAARNRGIHAARGEMLCFTDADCVPGASWIADVTAPLRRDPGIAACKGTYRTHQRAITARFVQLEYEDKYDQLRAHDHITFLDFYSAACRRQVLIDNGCFDEHFPNSEDRELSYRLASRGYLMVFQPSARVDHLHASTLPDYVHKKILNGYWTAQAVRRFPERSVEDTYTPQLMKLQIGLMGLLLAALAASPLVPPLLLLGLLLAAAFAATTLPFARKAWPKDRTISLLSPLLLAVRALALGIGYGWGVLRPPARRAVPGGA